MPTRPPNLDSLLVEVDRQRLVSARHEEEARRQRLFQALAALNTAAEWWQCPSPPALRIVAQLVKHLAIVLQQDGWSRALNLLSTGSTDQQLTLALLKEAAKAPLQRIVGRLQRFMDDSKGIVRIRGTLERLYDELTAISNQPSPPLNTTEQNILGLLAQAPKKGEAVAQRVGRSFDELLSNVVGSGIKKGGVP
jgi:hypothetical protein